MRKEKNPPLSILMRLYSVHMSGIQVLGFQSPLLLQCTTRKESYIPGGMCVTIGETGASRGGGGAVACRVMCLCTVQGLNRDPTSVKCR
jgi:hypothetical protein